MFSIRSQDVSWAILYISCWFVGRSSNAAVNWYSMFKCREQRWGPGPQSAQWPTLCSERSHETSLSIIGCSISMNGPVDTIEIRGGQSIAGCCHLLARRHTGMANSSCGKYHAFLSFFTLNSLPIFQLKQSWISTSEVDDATHSPTIKMYICCSLKTNLKQTETTLRLWANSNSWIFCGTSNPRWTT